jgi:serine/threonine-protein kinase
MATCPSCRTRYANDVSTCAADGEALLPDEAFDAADGDIPAGTTVGEYQIEGKLGEGGFGAVYRAVHPLIGKTVAIKVLNRQYSSNPQMVSRFIAEARAVNQIRHRNIIDIFSFGKLDDGRQYYVMELLEGQTFDGYLRERGALSPDEALPILRAVGRALDAAHAAGIAHRDLKPENIFLVFDEDGGAFPKLLDFGIAKLLADSAMAHKTRTGTPMGTPHYMSPEQCRGKNVDHRTDVYSFGVMVHQVLTGQVPFDGDDVMDVLIKQTSAVAPPMSTVRADLPKELDAPVLHMLEKDPARRPESLAAAVDALAEAASRAGFSVPVHARSDARRTTTGSGGGPRVVTGGGAKVTPAEAALAEARTIVHTEGDTPGESKTLRGAEADVKPEPSRRTALVAVLGAIALVGAGAFLALRGGGGTSPEGLVPVATVTAEAKPSAMPTAEPAVTPAVASAAASAEALPADVELTIETNLKDVDVLFDGKSIGKAPGVVKLPRGDAKVTLTLQAPGYKPTDVQVTPSANGVVSATLAKLVTAPAVQAAHPKKTPGEIENPF